MGDKVCSGWLGLNKPEGMTSMAVTSAVKRLLDVKKAGHAGTLDPFASGVLPIAVGPTTKAIIWAMASKKIYAFRIRFGTSTDSGDNQGAVVKTSARRPSADQIRSILDQFRGLVEQIPPSLSAIKINGRRAYALTRSGMIPDMPKRLVQVDRLDLIRFSDPDEAFFECVCGKGTYIRALARDICAQLDVDGHVSQLCRLAVGKFRLSQTITLDSLDQLGHIEARRSHLLPLAVGLDDMRMVTVDQSLSTALRQGVRLDMAQLEGSLGQNGETPFLVRGPDDEPVAVVQWDEGDRLRSLRVFQAEA